MFGVMIMTEEKAKKDLRTAKKSVDSPKRKTVSDSAKSKKKVESSKKTNSTKKESTNTRKTAGSKPNKKKESLKKQVIVNDELLSNNLPSAQNEIKRTEREKSSNLDDSTPKVKKNKKSKKKTTAGMPDLEIDKVKNEVISADIHEKTETDSNVIPLTPQNEVMDENTSTNEPLTETLENQSVTVPKEEEEEISEEHEQVSDSVKLDTSTIPPQQPTEESKESTKLHSFEKNKKRFSIALLFFNIRFFFEETWLKISYAFTSLASSISSLFISNKSKKKIKKTSPENETQDDLRTFEVSTSKDVNYEEDFEKTLVLKKISDFEDHKPSPPEKKTSKLKVFFAGFIIFLICIGLVVGSFGIGIITKITANGPELNLNDFIGQESSKIYDGDGNVIAELGAYLRENITYNDLPECVVDAFVAIEDSRFFEHNGFDLPRFTKAFLENIKTMSFSQGGSTFTMQLVKNTYFSIDDIHSSTIAQKSIDRKVQEIDLALRIENDMSKVEIFEKYLNKLNFGGNIRGVQKASLYYFGKSVNEINLSEAALLAGIINRPNDYNPYNYLENATQRRDTVLNMMSYHGYITPAEADLAKSIKVEDLLVGEQRTYNRTENQYQSYIDAVVQEVQQLTGKDPALASMKIYTYMNVDVQSTIDGIQDGTIPIPFPDDLMQVAMISMNNQTGAILGVGGGRNYDGARLLNRATSNFKQPGSAVKPFLSYALAFEHLYWSSNHVLTDRPMTYKGSSLVLKNFDRKYRGDVLLNQAVGQSLNIPAIDTLQQVIDEIGKEKIVEYMQTIGFTKVTNENFDISYAIGGSTYETTVLEMAGAHAMLINKGIYNKPHTVEKIVMQDGSVIYPDKQNVKVLSTGTAYLSSELMRYAVEGPYFNYMQILKNKDYPVYAKTGTTDWGKDGLRFGIPQGAAKDKWMISSTTQFTNAVWLGYDKGVKDKATYFNGYKSGLNIPGKISKILMDTVQSTSSIIPEAIPKPDDIEEITYVLGSWPYAYPESWMGSDVLTTALIRKGHPPLTSIQESIPDDLTNTLSSLNVTTLEDGSLAVTWGVSGRCSGGIKDLTLNDGKNYIPASGACIFDPSIAIGYPSYFATVYVDEVPLYNITGTGGYYQGWPGDLYGTVKVCGGFSTETGTSNTMCSYVTY